MKLLSGGPSLATSRDQSVFLILHGRIATQSGRLGVPWHHFGSEQLDGAHRLLMAEIAPLKRADEVVGTGGHVLVHVLAHRRWGAGQRHAAEPVGMLASSLLVETLQLGVDVSPHFACR